MKKTLFVRSTALLLSTLFVALCFACYPISVSAASYRSAANGASSSYKSGKYYQHFQSIALTGDTRVDTLALALSQLGYQEGSSKTDLSGLNGSSGNYTEYNWNLGSLGAGYTYAWCATFMSWALYQSGAYSANLTSANSESSMARSHMGNSNYIWREASCYYWRQQLTQCGYFKSRSSGYTPKSGDLIFFLNSAGTSTSHIGMVVYTSGSTVYTVEGNTSSTSGVESNGGGVYFKSYSMSNSRIAGYGALPYAGSGSAATIDYSGANPTTGQYISTTSKWLYPSESASSYTATMPKYTMFNVTRVCSNGRLEVSYNGGTYYLLNNTDRVIQLTNSSGTSAGGNTSGITSLTSTSGYLAHSFDNKMTQIPGDIEWTHPFDNGDIPDAPVGTKIGLRGWVAFNQKVSKFGYYFDDDSSKITWDESGAFLEPTDDAVLAVSGNAQRFRITADTTGLSAGDHTIHYVVQLANGSVARMHSIKLTNLLASTGITTMTATPGYISHSFENKLTQIPGDVEYTHPFDDGDIPDAPAGTRVGIKGWVAFNQKVSKFGYYFDSDSSRITWDETGAFLETTDSAVLAVSPNAQRFRVWVDTKGLSAGDHTAHFVVKLANGSIALLHSMKLTNLLSSSALGITPMSSTMEYLDHCFDNKLTQIPGGAECLHAWDENGVNDAPAGTKVGVRGWVAFNQKVSQFGYYFDNNSTSITWDTTGAFLETTESAILEIGEYGQRFHIMANTTGLSAGNHTANFVVKLANGSVVLMNSMPLSNLEGAPTITTMATTPGYISHSLDNKMTQLPGDGEYMHPFDENAIPNAPIGTRVGIRGWVAFDQKITQFGYYLDDNNTEFIWDTTGAFLEATEDAVLAASPYAQRFRIWADTTGLPAGDHKVHFVAKLANGSVALINSMSLSNLGGTMTATPGYVSHSFDDKLTQVPGGAECLHPWDENGVSNAPIGTRVGIRGWIAFDRKVSQFGYYFDGNNASITWDTTGAFLETTEGPVLEISPNGQRFRIWADTSGLSAGNHTVSFVVKLVDGTVVSMKSMALTNLVASSSGDNESTGGSTGGTTQTPVYTGTEHYFKIKYYTSVTQIGGVSFSDLIGYRDPSYTASMTDDEKKALSIIPVVDASAKGISSANGIVYLTGEALINGGHSAYLWSVDGVTWYTIDSGTLADASSAFQTEASAYVSSIAPASGSFTNLAVDLSGYIGQTVTLYIAAKSRTVDAPVNFLKVTNLTVGSSGNSGSTHTHTYGAWTTVTAATCTTAGTQKHTCSCGASETQTIAATGHTNQTVAGTAATCTASGMTSGIKCSVCQAWITPQTTIAATGHSEQILTGIAATCTTSGLSDGKRCLACGTTTVPQTAIPATGHNDADGDQLCDGCGISLVTVCQHSYTTTTTDATCTASGQTVKTCSKCGDVQTTTIPATGHSYTTTTTDATCTESGTIVQTCSKCGASETQTIAAKGHTESEWIIDKPAQEGIPGAKHTRCTVCGVTIQTASIPALPSTHTHTYRWIVTKSATCTTAGTMTYRCTSCGYDNSTQTIPATGHTEVVDTAVAPTCTASGLTAGKHCSVCNVVITAQSTVPALGHTEETVAGKAATCSETGLTEGKRCTVCGEMTVAQTTIAKAPHVAGEWVVDKAVSCLSTGSRHTNCISCGETVDTERIAATGHTAGAWIVLTPATCTTAGAKQQSCVTCFTPVKNESIEATGHTAGEWETVTDATCAQVGKKVLHCANDGCTAELEKADIPLKDHTEGKWTVVTAATCITTGVKAQSCSACGDIIKTEIIAATGHTEGEWEVKDATCTESGVKTLPCSVCGAVIKTQTIVATGHVESDWIVDTAADVGKDGKKHTACTVCGITINSEIIEALPAETLPADSTATKPATEPESEPASKPATENDSTSEPDTTTEAKSGCGSTVGFGAMALLCAIAAGFVVSKKKED